MEEAGVMLRLGGSYDEFTDQERRIKKYVLKNLRDVANYSINDLSKTTGVSQSTISRFCRKLGYSNYRDFIVELAKEAASGYPRVNASVTSLSSEMDIANIVLRTECSALERTLKMLENARLNEIADLLLQNKRVAVFGTGGSFSIATDLYHKLSRLGFDCSQQTDIVFQKITASQLREGDVAWIISLSGYDRDMLEIAASAQRKGAKVISMLNDYNSPLSQQSDYPLYGAYLDNNAYTGTTESRLSLMYISDVLYTILTVKGVPDTIQTLEETRTVLEARLTGKE